MADLPEIEWPSFESILRELSPERIEARKKRQGALIAPDEDEVIRDIPESTVDDIAAVVLAEVSEATVAPEAPTFEGEDLLSDESINQLLGNEEFMGYLVDLDNPAPEDLTVSPEEAASASFIATSPEAPVEPKRAPLTSLFNNAHPDLYLDLEPETAWTPVEQETEPQLNADSTVDEEVSTPIIPLLPPADVELEDPWTDIRPGDEAADKDDKKIVFWAARPKFFGGTDRHEARARREADED